MCAHMFPTTNSHLEAFVDGASSDDAVVAASTHLCNLGVDASLDILTR